LAFVGEIDPPEAVARDLGIPEGERAIVRRRVMLLNDKPVELTDSYYTTSVAAGTALATPRKIPGGAVKLLADLGYVGATVQESVTAQPATDDERDALDLDDGEWVMTLARLTLAADGTAIEASVMTMPARQRRLLYTMKVG
jgi:DNA-binding GntR family transcriptional regulator